ncbi:MAG: ParB/RepB/Spo0J family partition protein [Nitrospirae bacterium]|nr:ParB/RepB/Spo0J family partition protein [Nitrospirota bacterium]
MKTVQELPLAEVFPNPDQPRKDFDPAKLEELAMSIKQYGVQEPIKVVFRNIPPLKIRGGTEGGVMTEEGVAGGEGSPQYMIVMGERRYRASKLAGLETIPAIVEDFTDAQVEELALIENIQREDLNIIEEAKAYQKLLDRGLSVEELAGMLGFKQPWRITERTSLLRLRGEYQDLALKGHLSPSQAFELSRVDGEDQLVVFRKINEGKLDTYEKLRAFVSAMLDDKAVVPLFDIAPLTEKERGVLTAYEAAIDKIVAFLNRTFKDNELVILKKVLRQNRGENIRKIEQMIAHLEKLRKALQLDALQEEAALEKLGAA